MPIYAFKSRTTAEKLKHFADHMGKNPLEVPDGNDVAVRVNLSRAEDEIYGKSAHEDGSYFMSSGTAERYQTSAADNFAKIHRNLGMPILTEGINIEDTNIPAGADCLAISDTYNSTFFMTPTPSECFGVLQAEWSGDFESPVEVELSEGFSIGGLRTVEIYPALTLDPSVTLEAGTVVEVRYLKSVQKWFFFRRTGTASAISAAVTGRWYSGWYVEGTNTPALPSKLFYRQYLGPDLVVPAEILELNAIISYRSDSSKIIAWVNCENFNVCTNDEYENVLSLGWLGFPWDWEKGDFKDTAPEFFYTDGNVILPEHLGFHLKLVDPNGRDLPYGEDGTVDGYTCYTGLDSLNLNSSYGILYYDKTRNVWAWNESEGSRQETNTGSAIPTTDGFSETLGEVTVSYHDYPYLVTDAPVFGCYKFTQTGDFWVAGFYESYRNNAGFYGGFRVTAQNDWSLDYSGKDVTFNIFSKSGNTITFKTGKEDMIQYSCMWTGDGEVQLEPVLPTFSALTCESFLEFLYQYTSDMYPIRTHEEEYYIPDPESSQGRYRFPDGYLESTCDFSDDSETETLTLYEIYERRYDLTEGSKDGVPGFYLDAKFHPSEGSPLLEAMEVPYVFDENLDQTFNITGELVTNQVPNANVKIARAFPEILI